MLISGPIDISDSDGEALGTVGAEAMVIQASVEEGLQTHVKPLEAEETQASVEEGLQTPVKPLEAEKTQASPVKPLEAEETQAYQVDTLVISDALLLEDRVPKGRPSPLRRLRSKQALRGSTTKELPGLQALEAPDDSQTPSPKPLSLAVAPFTPPKQPMTRDAQLAIKSFRADAGKATHPLDWTQAQEEDMWKEYELFVEEREASRLKRKSEVPDEATYGNKKPRAQMDDGRPVIFARRYAPGTHVKGRAVWESLVDAFMEIILPDLEPGMQTKTEVSFLQECSLNSCLLFKCTAVHG